MPVIEQTKQNTQTAEEEFVSIAEAFDTIPTTEAISDEAQIVADPHLWRWQRHGHGKYKGRYYRLVNVQTGRTIKGGYLSPEMIELLNRIYPRKGKGNHAKGANRTSRAKHTKPTNQNG